MTSTIQTITVPATIARGSYQQHVVRHGHIPGVLSGAEIRGKARSYGGGYARSRARVAATLRALGVTQSMILHPESRRWTRVWTDATGQPVRLAF